MITISITANIDIITTITTIMKLPPQASHSSCSYNILFILHIVHTTKYESVVHIQNMKYCHLKHHIQVVHSFHFPLHSLNTLLHNLLREKIVRLSNYFVIQIKKNMDSFSFSISSISLLSSEVEQPLFLIVSHSRCTFFVLLLLKVICIDCICI